MKHSTEDELIELLSERTPAISVELDRDQARALIRYLVAVLDVNRRINITRIIEPREAVQLHLVDSLLAVASLSGAPDGALLDIGTGGGFPGVPLAVASGRKTMLLDSVGKKLGAVRQCLPFLGEFAKRIQVAPERAEEHAASHARAYATVVARAVAPLPSLVELASPLLCVQGKLICLKARLDSAEREGGATVAGIAGMREVTCEETSLPESGEIRTLVTYEKVRPSSIPLPRRTGLAQTRPLV